MEYSRKNYVRRSIPSKKYILQDSTEKSRHERVKSHFLSICSSEEKLTFGISETKTVPPPVIDFQPKITIKPKLNPVKREKELILPQVLPEP